MINLSNYKGGGIMGEKIYIFNVIEEFKELIKQSNEVEISCKIKGHIYWFVFKYRKGIGIYMGLMDDLYLEIMKEDDRWGIINWGKFFRGWHWGISWGDIDVNGDGEVDSDEYIEKFIQDIVLEHVDDKMINTEVESIFSIIETDIPGRYEHSIYVNKDSSTDNDSLISDDSSIDK